MAKHSINLMSFNTQHCLSFKEQKIDFEIMARTINDQGADIVGLNEMYGFEKDPELVNQTQRLASAAGFEYSFFAPALENEGMQYGNGLISKYKIVSAERILIPDPNPRKYNDYYETRCLLKARLENGLTVIVTHFGLNPDEHENAVRSVLGNLEKEKCVLMGDFNVEPTSPVLNPIREVMYDTAELFASPLLSWPSDKPRKKIDYIFTSGDIEVKCADIPSIIASDHRPHTATILI